MGSIFGGGDSKVTAGEKAKPNEGATTKNDYGYNAENFRGNNFVVSPGIAAMQRQAGGGTYNQDSGILDSTLLSAYMDRRPSPDKMDLAAYAMQQGMNQMNGQPVQPWTGGQVQQGGPGTGIAYTPDTPGSDAPQQWDMREMLKKLLSGYSRAHRPEN